MKKFFFFLLIGLGQAAHADEYADVKKIKNSTLCVVIDDENIVAYTKLQAAVQNFWDFSKVKYIKKNEIETYINDPNFAVMTFIAKSLDPGQEPHYSVASIGLATEVKRFSGWNLYILMGDKKNKYMAEKPPLRHYDIGDLHPVCSVSFPEDKVNLGSFDYLVAHALKVLLYDVQNIEKMRKVQEFGIFGAPEKDKGAIFYDDGKSQIDKTLYIEKEMADKKGVEKKYAQALGISVDNIKIATREEIASAIEIGSGAINYTLMFDQKEPLIYSGKDSKPIARLK